MVKVEVTKYEAGYYIDRIVLLNSSHRPINTIFEELYRLVEFVNWWLSEKSLFANKYELLITHHE